MAKSFYFYDLETSGFSSKRDRIMQFAGQRTDLKLNPIGDPDNFLVKLPDDILPSPEAILFTGLSLKENTLKGISEPKMARIFNEDIAKEGTIFVGFNNIRFDDEFIRHLNYRNFYDAYSWHWAMDRSRWDLMDVVRMTRALRPEGITWPRNLEGKAVNNLSKLTAANKLEHYKAHDALSDVLATIAVAKLLQTKQPKLFNYLLNLKDKKLSNEIIHSSSPFIYTTGKYPSEFLHTSVVLTLEFSATTSTAQVYDLRIDPSSLINANINDLVEKWRYDPEKPRQDIPIKTIKLNRCPAVAPLSVLDKDSIKRLKIDIKKIEDHAALLKKNRNELFSKINEVIKLLNAERDQRQKASKSYADEQLYSKFITAPDKDTLPKARQMPPDPGLRFKEKRLSDLYLIYLARNYRSLLSSEQEHKWRELTAERLFTGEPSQIERFNNELKEQKQLHKNNKLISELEDLLKEVESDYGEHGLARVA